MNKHIELAKMIAFYAHKDQKRKYTNEPYFVHCEEVARIVELNGGTDFMIAAALMHDVLEDTPYTSDDLLNLNVSPSIVGLVEWLTDSTKPSDGNRAKRKAIDRNRLAEAPDEAKAIKCADLISNTASIVEHDKEFARVYLREKELLLPCLKFDFDMTRYRKLFVLAHDSLVEAQKKMVQHQLGLKHLDDLPDWEGA